MDLATRPTPDGSAVELRIAGEFDLAQLPAFKSASSAVLRDGFSRVIVDLTDVSFLDSSGVGALLGLRRRCRDAGGDLVVQPSTVVRRVLEACEVEGHFGLTVGQTPSPQGVEA